MSYYNEDHFAHFGVKGMHWGSKKHQESRKEFKTRSKKELMDFHEAKINRVLQTSLKKGENVLISSKLPGDFAHTIMTGKQFVDHVSSGKAFDVNTTDVFASKNKGPGQFVLNPNPNPKHTPSVRR